MSGPVDKLYNKAHASQMIMKNYVSYIKKSVVMILTLLKRSISGKGNKKGELTYMYFMLIYDEIIGEKKSQNFRLGLVKRGLRTTFLQIFFF